MQIFDLCSVTLHFYFCFLHFRWTWNLANKMLTI
jgi:hypothetical protein